MITKILVTLAVIAICLWVLSARGRSELRVVPNPTAERNRKTLLVAALAFMLVMASAAAVTVYLKFDEDDTVLTVHVVDTRSGKTQSYRVRKGDIHGDGFTTLDGTQVFVAEVERIEIEAPK